MSGSEMKIQLDPVALREATAQAISGVLTPEIRAQVIQEAIRALLAPATTAYGSGKSPLQRAFEDAVQSLVRDEAKRLVEVSPEIRGKVLTLLRETADKVFSADPEKLAQRMADAFVTSMSKREY